MVRVRKLSLLVYTSLCLKSTATATSAGLVDQIARALGAVAARTCNKHNPISRFQSVEIYRFRQALIGVFSVIYNLFLNEERGNLLNQRQLFNQKNWSPGSSELTGSSSVAAELV